MRVDPNSPASDGDVVVAATAAGSTEHARMPMGGVDRDILNGRSLGSLHADSHSTVVAFTDHNVDVGKHLAVVDVCLGRERIYFLIFQIT